MISFWFDRSFLSETVLLLQNSEGSQSKVWI